MPSHDSLRTPSSSWLSWVLAKHIMLCLRSVYILYDYCGRFNSLPHQWSKQIKQNELKNKVYLKYTIFFLYSRWSNMKERRRERREGRGRENKSLFLNNSKKLIYWILSTFEILFRKRLNWNLNLKLYVETERVS